MITRLYWPAIESDKTNDIKPVQHMEKARDDINAASTSSIKIHRQ